MEGKLFLFLLSPYFEETGGTDRNDSICSALDIFGGSQVKFDDLVKYNRAQ